MKYVVAAIIVFTVARIAVTLRTFSATVDEATHIGAGLEMYQEHRYHFHRHNPPLPRLIFAAIPYAIGMRVDLASDVYTQLLSVFYTQNGGKYERKLVASRVGNLVFVILACVGMWLYARDELDEKTSLVALTLFATQPIILGYSGLVTHDIAATAGTAFAIVAFLRWLRAPDWKRAAMFGAAYGASVLCKFSCIAYVPAACAVIALVRLIDGRATLHNMKTLGAAIAMTCVVVWAGYGFQIGTISDLGEHAFGLGPFATSVLQRLDPRIPLPAPQLFSGIALMQIDRGTFPQYLFGRVSSDGWWWYFPAAIVLKTPLPFLALIVIGWLDRSHRGVYVESMLAAAAMIFLATNSHLDLGIRYVLPAYVPLTVAAALPFARMKRTALVLVAAQVVLSLAAHPDYFPYFNALAGKDPSKCLIDSNLDWGQDILRLRSEVRNLGVERIAIRDSGLINFDYLGFPPNEAAMPDPPSTGWVAIGDHVYRMDHYRWLDGLPYRRIGKSIRLFNVPPRGR